MKADAFEKKEELLNEAKMNVVLVLLIKDHLFIKRMLTTWHPYTRASFFSERLSASPRKKSPTETRTTKGNLNASVYTHYRTEMTQKKDRKRFVIYPCGPITCT